MNAFFFHLGDVQQIDGYSCGPLEGSFGEPHPYIGYALLAVGIPTIWLYSICLATMMAKPLRKTTCYHIMIYLGLIDIGAIFVNSIETGILSIQGAVYCTYPRLIYVTGAAGLALWCCSCLTCLILVLNRLLSLSSAGSTQVQADPWWHSALYLTAASIYTLFFFLFTSPLLFSSTHTAWFFSPFIDGYDDKNYVNHPHSVNNLLIVAATACAYSWFVINLRQKYKKHEQTFSFKNNPIVIQAVLMCFFNLVAALIYVYMQYFTVWPPLILIGHFCWVFGHGCPPYLYLCLNATMRRKVLLFLRISYLKRKKTILPVREESKEAKINQIHSLNLPKMLIIKQNNVED